MCVICEKLGMTVEGVRSLHFITCPAYHDENGKRRLVHQGHCTGAFDQAPCKHYIAESANSSSVCWCGLEKELARRKEAQARAMREQAARERERQEALRQMRQRYPLDVVCDE